MELPDAPEKRSCLHSLNQQITPVDVAAMMALLKLARVAEGHGKTDNWVDLAGYAACGAEIESSGAPEVEK